ncbi:MAG: hypothetical protein P8I44_11095 [Phycisphaerales bacterium]|nr:hypothetical protein [Phycisphaerales bacterium]
MPASTDRREDGPRGSMLGRLAASPGRLGAWLVAAIYFVAFSIVWTIAHELSDLHGTRLPLTFEWESRVPLQRWAIPLYFTLDLSVILLPFIFRSAREAIPPMAILLLQVVIAAPFFVLLPIENAYVDDMPTGVWGAFLFEPLGMKNVSQWNQTPSLHVTYALTVATVVGRRWGGWWWFIGLAWAVPVSITTMLVHEHHLICVVGGLLLYAATIPLLRRWSGRCSLDSSGRDPGMNHPAG